VTAHNVMVFLGADDFHQKAQQLRDNQSSKKKAACLKSLKAFVPSSKTRLTWDEAVAGQSTS
jgi:hypothetical protein